MSVVSMATFWALARIILAIFFRCLGVMWFAPCFGNPEVSRFLRFALAIALSALVIPTIADRCLDSTVDFQGLNVSFAISFAVDLANEALLGALIGLTLKCYFSAFHVAGEIVSRLGGISVVGAFDSSLGEEASPLSRFYTLCALLLFAFCGGIEIFLDGFLRLCVETPPGSLIGADALALKFVATLSASFVLALKISVPVVLTTGLLYLSVGFANRVTPQINLSSASFSISSLLALTTLSLTFGISCFLFKEEILRFVEGLLPSAP